MSDFASKPEIGNVCANPASGPQKDDSRRCDQTKLLEIDDAIRDLDKKLSDLEAALHITVRSGGK